MIIDGIEIDSLLRARTNFEAFRIDMVTKRDKAGAIQAFEYTYERAWKIMKKLIEKRGGIPFSINGTRDIFRAAAVLNMIPNPTLWFTFIEARNITVHTYDEKEVDMVIAVFDDFSRELTLFLANIGVPT
jgi:nucleotidyltransferase substrate binding protein (TIGR01987 family)